MRLPRMTTRRWMIVIGVAALNLAAAHLLFAYETGLVFGIALNGLLLQVALWRLTRNRGLKRAFYAGFIAAGILSGGHFIWMRTDSLGLRPYVAPTTIQVAASPSLWSRILEECAALLEWPYEHSINCPTSPRYSTARDEDVVPWIVFTLLAFLPQVLIASAGGLLGSFILWVRILASRGHNG